MKTLILGLTLCFFASSALANSDDQRLMELLRKKSDLQMVGKDLSAQELAEFEKLITQRGLVKVAEMQNQLKLESQSAQVPSGIASPETKAFSGTASVTNSQPIQSASSTAQNPATQVAPKVPPIEIKPEPLKPLTTKCDANDQTCKNILSLRERAQNTLPPPKPAAMKDALKNDLEETKDLNANFMNEVKKESKPEKSKEVKKEDSPELADPNYLKRMKKEMNQISQMRATIDEVKNPSIKPVSLPQTSGKGTIYEPLPADTGVKPNGFYVERDSQNIVTKRIGPKDAITIKMCISYGVSINLDESIDTELQRVILDDKIYFDAQEFENKRGVYVKLIKAVPLGSRWDSAIRLVRKSDDKTYLVNLQAVGCPEGQIDFPRIVYLKEKYDILEVKQGDVLTPEDMIIQVSQGLTRKNIHKPMVYDMVASPGSEWVVFGLETTPDQTLSKPENVEFQALDSLQINKIKTKWEYMKLQSEKASELRGQTSYRYKIMMAIDKAYVLKNRYVYLVYINKETKHYEYIQLDTLTYFKSLKDRGFDL